MKEVTRLKIVLTLKLKVIRSIYKYDKKSLILPLET